MASTWGDEPVRQETIRDSKHFAATVQRLMTVLPPEPAGELVHQRDYTVKSYRQSADRLRIRGVIQDQKPPGVYIEDDPEPLSVHQMVVDLVLDFPTLEIVEAEVVMEVTPHATCTSIETTYQQLVGVSIARGFSRTVRDLFGGPRGCTHVGALLQAMAPIAIQSLWSMRALDETPVALTAAEALEQRRQGLAFNTNTCHVWEEDGELMKKAMAGDELDPPLWVVDRLEKLGRSPDDWRMRQQAD